MEWAGRSHVWGGRKVSLEELCFSKSRASFEDVLPLHGCFVSAPAKELIACRAARLCGEKG